MVIIGTITIYITITMSTFAASSPIEKLPAALLKNGGYI